MPDGFCPAWLRRLPIADLWMASVAIALPQAWQFFLLAFWATVEQLENKSRQEEDLLN